MVKISGGGKGMIQIKNHMDYISRNGQIELETQDGEVVNGRAELQMLRDEWKYGGFQVAEENDVKDAFNIVLSMPEGTPALAVKNAARDFAGAGVRRLPVCDGPAHPMIPIRIRTQPNTRMFT